MRNLMPFFLYVYAASQTLQQIKAVRHWTLVSPIPLSNGLDVLLPA